MNLIPGLTAAPKQKLTFVLDNGVSFSLSLYFVPMQYGWFITNLTYQNFQINSLRITNNANMLYQWQNIIPFGLGCFSPSQREPSLQEDFSTGASNLYVLNEEECKAYTNYIQTGILPA